MTGWQVLWWILAVAAVVATAWWWRQMGWLDVRTMDNTANAGSDDHRDPRDTAGGLAAAHRPDLLVSAPTQNDPADLDTQPGVGGILTSVTDLGAEYTPTEARTNRIFDRLETRIRSIIMGAADDAVKGAVEQLNKARAEVQAQDASQDANAVSPETLKSLRDVAQSFDDLNPDAPADTGGGEETPDPQPEPTPEPAPADTGGNPDGETDTSE